MNEKEFNNLYKKISAIISAKDPASLGGVSDEYDREVHEMIRVIMKEKRVPSCEEIEELFRRSFKDAVSLSHEGFAYLAEEVERIVEKYKEK